MIFSQFQEILEIITIQEGNEGQDVITNNNKVTSKPKDNRQSDESCLHDQGSTSAATPSTSNKNGKGHTRTKYTKSARLTDSIKNNKKFLDLSQNSISCTSSYRKSKLELIQKHYETKGSYYKSKLEALQKKDQYYEKKN